VSLGQVLPHFILSAGALKELYRLYTEKNEVRSNEAVLCYLHGDATSPRAKKVFLEGVKLKKKEAHAAGAWCVPVYAIANGSKPGLSQEGYVSTIAAVQSSYRDEYADNVSLKLQPQVLVFRSSPHAAQLDFQLECAASPVLFKFSLVRNLPLLMTPLAASLARREFSTESGNLRSGYLTLDRTRKAVPLLKVDPLVLQQPLVGVWVYGVQIDDAWDEETARRQLADPFLYFACIGYLMSEAIKERVGPEKNTFLVALYPAGDQESGGSLPRFFECSFSEFLSPPPRPLPMELYSHTRSCLVGVSKFSTDVELTLAAAPTSEWEAARREAKIPTAPHSEKATDPESTEARTPADNNALERSQTSIGGLSDVANGDESEDVTSGWTIPTDVMRKNAAADTKARSQISLRSEKKAGATAVSAEFAMEVEEKAGSGTSDDELHDAMCTHAKDVSRPPKSKDDKDDAEPPKREWFGTDNSNSFRSCCKTQQLLTIQHQQILENQQRQLHEMQEQIAQLRRLLQAARSSSMKQVRSTPDEADYDSDASSSSIGAVADVSNISSTFSRHGNGRLSSQSSIVSPPRRSGEGPFSDLSSVHTHQENKSAGEDENEEKDVSLSSLGLSSISSGSADADLSSLSSSLVGERLKQLDSSPAHETKPDDNKDDGPVEALSCSQLSMSAAHNTDAQHNVDAEAEPANECDTKERTSAQDLSIGELSASANVDSTRDPDEKGVKFALHDEEASAADADVDASGDDQSVGERLLSPDAYLRKVGGFVDHHGGCFTTPPLDFHSFCVPRIKFSSEAPECSLSDSDDEEIRLIEQKYKRLMAA
jgi:hypothetical protein